jgi:hypothetical protein
MLQHRAKAGGIWDAVDANALNQQVIELEKQALRRAAEWARLGCRMYHHMIPKPNFSLGTRLTG